METNQEIKNVLYDYTCDYCGYDIRQGREVFICKDPVVLVTCSKVCARKYDEVYLSGKEKDAVEGASLVDAVNYRRADNQEKKISQLGEQRVIYDKDRFRLGLTTIAIIEDVGSGSSRDRIGLKKVVGLVNKGMVRVVYVTTPDRLADDETLFNELLEFFYENHVTLFVDGAIYEKNRT